MAFMKIVCIMVFIDIASFKIIISMKRGVLRFVSMPFLISEKAMGKKNYHRNFQIRKYDFFSI